MKAMELRVLKEDSWTLELSPAPRGASKVNVETTVTNRSFILGPENAGNFCIARRSRGISAIVSRRLPRRGLLARNRSCGRFEIAVGI